MPTVLTSGAPKGDGKSFGGFFQNLVKGAGSFAAGIPMGLWNLGKTGASDAVHALSFGGIGDSFKSDDLAKGIYDYYKNDSALGALVQGQWGKAGRLGYKDPFAAGMDVWGLAAGGAGTAAKAGSLAARKGVIGGAAADKAMRFAGYTPAARSGSLVGDAARLTSLPGGGTYVRASKSVTAPSGASYSKTLSKNPVSRAVQEALGDLQTNLAARSPRIAARQERRVYKRHVRDAARLTSRDRDATLAAYAGQLDTLRSAAGGNKELADLAGTIRLSGMTPDEWIAGYRRVLSGEAAQDAKNMYGQLKARLDDWDREARLDVDPPDAKLLDDLRRDVDKWDLLHREYKLDNDARIALGARVKTAESHLDQIRQLDTTPEMQAWHDEAKKLGELTEREHLYARGGHLPEQGVERLASELRNNRSWEWRALFPLESPPERVLSGAVFRSHEYADPKTLKVTGKLSGLKKAHTTPGSSLKREGASFLRGLDRVDLDVLPDTYTQQRLANLHNNLLDGVMDNYEPMTRLEYQKRLAAGEDLVDVAERRPDYSQRLARSQAETMDRLASVSRNAAESDAGDAAKLAVAAEEAARVFAAGGAKHHDEVVHAVPRAVWDAISADQRHAQAMMNKLQGFDKATDYWRAMVLSYRAPGWMLNNTLGQGILLALQDSGIGAVKEALKAWNFSDDAKRLKGAVDDAAGEVTSTGTSKQWERSRATKRDRSLFLRGADKIAEWNAKGADDPTRRVAFLREIRPAMERVKQATGITDDAEIIRLIAKEAPDVMDEAIQQTVGKMVDFTDLSPFEQRWMRALFPFYSWMKGSTKSAGRLLRDEPGRAYGIGMVGQDGMEDTAEKLGELPEFISGAIPVPGLFQNDKGTRVFSTAAFNPVTSPADIFAGLGQYAPVVGGKQSFGPESFMSQMHPLAKMGLGALTGTDPFWGSDLQGQSILAGLIPYKMQNAGDFAVGQGIRSIPALTTMDEALRRKRGAVQRSMYEGAWWRPLAQYATGMPVKDLVPSVANQRAREEQSAGSTSKY